MTTLDKMLQGLANALGASLSTLTTTAKTVVGAINELKSGLTTANTNISTNTTKIGSGSLDTTSQTLIGAINELKTLLPKRISNETVTVNIGGSQTVQCFTVNGPAIMILYYINAPAGYISYPNASPTNGCAIRVEGGTNHTVYGYGSGEAGNYGWVNAGETRLEYLYLLSYEGTITFSAKSHTSTAQTVTFKYCVIEF